jgi:hypothetical protein
MHTLEPYYLWREFYRAEDDERSSFFEREYSEFEYTHQIYNHLIHPQWDEFGSPTLYIKIIYADYETGFAIIEMIGEWNDAINNDIMFLKREVIELLMDAGIDKFIMVGENVLNFHASDDSYYEEWFSDAENGWIAFINFREHVLDEFKASNIDYYVNFGGELDDLAWRKFLPNQFFDTVEAMLRHRLA